MERFGSPSRNPVPMNEALEFNARLHLLIIMAKAMLNQYPAGAWRIRAIHENVHTIHCLLNQMKPALFQKISDPHIFRQRVKLLCIMVTAGMSDPDSQGRFRQQAVQENIDEIIVQAFNRKMPGLFETLLKVA